jgi:hypothetical protein
MRMLTRPLTALLLGLCLPLPGFAQAEPMPLLTRLDLAVSVDYETGRIAGTAALTLENTSPTELTRVPLLLNRLMQVESVRDGGGRELLLRQRVTTYDEAPMFQVTAAEVDLAQPLPPGQTVRLDVSYGGHLVGYTETGMRYTRDRVQREFTILREDVYAFPSVGTTSARANRLAPRGLFDFEVTATVPEDLVVATGGEPVGRSVENGLATWRFRSRDPAPFMVVVIAPYRVAEADGLRVYYFPEDADGAEMVLEAAQRAAARFGEIFGPLDRPMTLSIMQVPEGWGSQASLAGGIIQEAGAFRDRAQLRYLYHEISHLWNATDLERPSPRWNEGLATYFEDRMARELDGWDGAAAAMQQTARRLVERCPPDRPCGRIPMRDYGDHRLTDLSYSVGALMFAALDHALGEEAFDRALHQHFQAHQAAGTTTDDLVRAFVEVGGPVARRILDDWLDTTGWLDRLREADSLESVFEGYRSAGVAGRGDGGPNQKTSR